jgi:N-hydroxyarylamine O-acetyltransferase
VARGDDSFGPDFDHMALLVRLDEPWLADVGFGDCFRLPLRLSTRDAQPGGDGHSYRVVPEGPYRILQRRDDGGPWEAQYRFTLQARGLADYAVMCHYHQTSPDSHFTQRRICSRATPGGRITLSNTRLIVTADRQRREHELEGEQAVADALRAHFGLELGA